uniref:Uncharacterized protein n=1 Tax=Rhizophora mucronata TaxID=61149 RepID=A0A2P2NCW5_RHIMU
MLWSLKMILWSFKKFRMVIHTSYDPVLIRNLFRFILGRHMNSIRSLLVFLSSRWKLLPG